MVSHPVRGRGRHPADRDRAIDVIRIVSLVGVVFGHTITATSTIRDDVFIWSNLLTVGLLLCVAGSATLTSVAWGLKDQGAYCVAVMIAALVTARLLATDSTARTARPADPIAA